MTIHYTTNFGVAYADDQTALVDLAAVTQAIAVNLDAAMGRAGYTPPDSSSFAALSATVTANGSRLTTVENKLAAVTPYARIGGATSGTTTQSLATGQYTTLLLNSIEEESGYVNSSSAGWQSATGRWQLGAWTATSAVSNKITAPDTFIFLGGGELANNTTTGKVEAGKITAGGDLGALDDTPKDFSSTAAGYGVCAANGQLFVFGGAGGAPSSGAKSAQIIAPAPTLANNSWNSEGLTMTQSRYLMGSSVQSAFIFLLGGQTGEPSNASKTTELVIW